MATPTSPRRPVPGGPVAYRRRLRMVGPWLALMLPLLVGLVAVAVVRLWPCTGNRCVVPGAAGTTLAALALPTAAPLGLPWRGGPALEAAALVTSLALWMTLGSWASRRATRSPVADWTDWRREFARLVAAVWAGVTVGLAGMVVGTVLLG